MELLGRGRAAVVGLVLVAWPLCLASRSASACEGERFYREEDIAQSVQRARSSIALRQPEAALVELLRADEQLHCLASAIPTELLWKLSISRGQAMVLADQPQGARQAFGRALALAPGRGWSAMLGDAGRDVYLAVRSDVAASPAVKLEVPILAVEHELAVDGEPAREVNGAYRLSIGEHLVTWREEPGGPAHMEWVQVSAFPSQQLTRVANSWVVLPNDPTPRPPRWRAPAGVAIGLGGAALGLGVASLWLGNHLDAPGIGAPSGDDLSDPRFYESIDGVYLCDFDLSELSAGQSSIGELEDAYRFMREESGLCTFFTNARNQSWRLTGVVGAGAMVAGGVTISMRRGSTAPRTFRVVTGPLQIGIDGRF